MNQDHIFLQSYWSNFNSLLSLSCHLIPWIKWQSLVKNFSSRWSADFLPTSYYDSPTLTSFHSLLKAISTVFYHHLIIWSFDVDGKTLSKFLLLQDDPCYNIHAIHISILLPDALPLINHKHQASLTLTPYLLALFYSRISRRDSF